MRAKLARAGIAVALVAVALEVGLRALAPGLALPDDERLSYLHHPVLGWLPAPGSERWVQGARRVHVVHNARGFRDREHGEKRRPRLLFAGDSYVWGYDVEAAERFTERLQARWPQVEVINVGVSGYGTDQEFLLLQTALPDYAPDAVVLVLGPNDALDNRRNHVDGRYWKPYFVLDEGTLRLRGVPVPVSVAYRAQQHPLLLGSYTARAAFRAGQRLSGAAVPREVPDPTEALLAAMAAEVRASGAAFAIGWVGVDGLPEGVRAWLRERVGPDAASVRLPEALCRRQGIPCLDLSHDLVYPSHGWHWTPAGHALVAERLGAWLEGLGWIPDAGTDGGAPSLDGVSELAQPPLLGLLQRHPL